MKKEAIIIFTRVPIPGKTKTRLQTCLSPKDCALIHSNFLKDIFNVCKKTKKDILIFYTPKSDKHILVNLLGENNTYIPQEGSDLGEKMANAISYVLDKNYESCVLIGTDVPQIKSVTLLNAFYYLNNKDVVIGPTYDKGYYLIGMKKVHRGIFENQTYGSGDVLSNTIEQFKRLGLSYELVDTCLDIDDKQDLSILKKDIQNRKTVDCINTINFLKNK